MDLFEVTKQNAQFARKMLTEGSYAYAGMGVTSVVMYGILESFRAAVLGLGYIILWPIGRVAGLFVRK